MSQGFKYAERQEAAGVLSAHFGGFRRARWPGWKPSEVPSYLVTFLQGMGPSLTALRPQFEGFSNVLPWARSDGNDSVEDVVEEESAALKLLAAIGARRGQNSG